MGQSATLSLRDALGAKHRHAGAAACGGPPRACAVGIRYDCAVHENRPCLDDHASEVQRHQAPDDPVPLVGRLSVARRERRRLRDLHAGPGGSRRDVEPRSREDQGLQARRDRRTTLFAVLHGGGCRSGEAATRARAGRGARTLRGRKLASSKGRHELLGERRHHCASRRERHASRLREGHPRPDGPPRHRGACPTSGAPVPPARRRRRRLRDLHVGSERSRRDVEHRGEPREGLHRGRDHRQGLLPLLPAGGSSGGQACAHPRGRSSRRALRRRGLASPQGRVTVLGERRHHVAAGR